MTLARRKLPVYSQKRILPVFFRLELGCSEPDFQVVDTVSGQREAALIKWKPRRSSYRFVHKPAACSVSTSKALGYRDPSQWRNQRGARPAVAGLDFSAAGLAGLTDRNCHGKSPDFPIFEPLNHGCPTQPVLSGSLIDATCTLWPAGRNLDTPALNT